MTAENHAIAEAQTLDAQQVVEQFLANLEQFDFDGAFEYIDDHCVYKNMPFHTAKGKARIQRDLNTMTKALDLFHVEMVNIAVNGNVVLTERVDTLGGRFFKTAIPLMGAFVVENGKITEWRDYFDWSSMFGKLGASSVTKWFR